MDDNRARFNIQIGNVDIGTIEKKFGAEQRMANPVHRRRDCHHSNQLDSSTLRKSLDSMPITNH